MISTVKKKDKKTLSRKKVINNQRKSNIDYFEVEKAITGKLYSGCSMDLDWKVENNEGIDEVSFKIKLLFLLVNKLSSEEFRQKILHSLIRVFGVLKASPVMFSVEQILGQPNEFKIVTSKKHFNMVYTAISLVENGIKPIPIV
mmetsp:Transcript_30374/g.31620  ORF Transcript_30374/g.31620 Transcript_30374/m.31620 type:complete len:144 (-) Transcript_30374:218-649(-)